VQCLNVLSLVPLRKVQDELVAGKHSRHVRDE